MHRRTRYGLVALAVLLAMLGGYGAYWAIVARRIEEGVAAWAQSARARRLDASWQSIEIGGFPGRFRIELTNARLRDRSLDPAPQLRLPVLSGDAVPWDPTVWRLRAPGGLVADLAGAGSRPPVRLAAPRAAGAVAFAGGGVTVWLRLYDAEAAAVGELRAGAADLWITLPAKPPRPGGEPNFRVAADLRALEVPVIARALGGSIGELAFGVRVRGALPGGKLAEALAAWRDAGGTVELDNLDLKWGNLGATATGTLSLDRDLQPVGGFSGAIEGYDRILRALVETGHMRPGEAGLAQLALTMLAKAGADGRPEIATSLTIGNGQIFLGPARLGPAPRLAWK